MLSPTDGHRADPGATPEATGDTLANRPTCQQVLCRLEEVDLAAIAAHFGIGTHTSIHDFDHHRKVAIPEGIDPSDSLATLA